MGRTPNFVRLSSIDRSRFITACRHGLVHLSWERVTLRLSRSEFRRMARLLGQVADGPLAGQVYDGELGLIWRDDEESEFRAGAAVLLFAPDEFKAFATMCLRALDQLDKILSSGAWDREEADGDPPGFLAQFRPNSFSEN